MRRTCVLAIAAAFAAPVHAQSNDTQPDDASRLDDVVVTATRTAVTVDASLAAVDVLTRKDIDRSQARSLPELLRGRAGIALVNQGGPGKLTTLFLRGTESDHVLVLVDGVRVGSATSGLVSLQDLPLEQVERVEIVRGPRSSLYGSDAIGGVIQVFTRRAGTGAGLRPRLSVAAGSHGYRDAGAGIGARTATGWFDVDGSWQHDDGINACTGIGFPLYAGCGTSHPDPDRDGYRNHALSLRAGLTPGAAWTLEGHALRSEGHNAYDGAVEWGLPDSSDTVQQVVGGTLRYAPEARPALQLTAGRNLDVSRQYLGGIFTDRFWSTRDSATLQAELAIAGNPLTLGLDWLRDRGAVGGAFGLHARGNRAGFVQYQGTFGRQQLQAAFRHDDNDQFGGHDTGSLAWGMAFAHGWRATASVGTAFKAPTFNELYFPFYGNPALRPETSRSVEAGLGWRGERSHWQLDAYQTDVADLISYDSRLFTANNLDRARIRGLEFGAGATLAGWQLATQATFADPRNRGAGPGAGDLLPRRSRRSARLDLDRAFGAWQLGASWIAEGMRYDDFANALRLGGYATLDLRAQRPLRRDWTLQAQLRNVFDRRYETAAYFNQPGREFTLGLRYAPR